MIRAEPPNSAVIPTTANRIMAVTRAIIKPDSFVKSNPGDNQNELERIDLKFDKNSDDSRTASTATGVQFELWDSAGQNRLSGNHFLTLILQPPLDYCSFVYNTSWSQINLPSGGSAPTRGDDFDTA